MLMLTIEVAEFFPSRLLSAHIVIDPQSPAGVQLPRTRCQWLQQLLQPQIWILIDILIFHFLSSFWINFYLEPSHRVKWSSSRAVSGLGCLQQRFHMGVIVCPEIPAKGCSRCTTEPSDQPPGPWCKNCMWTDQQNFPEVESKVRS